MTLIVCAQCKSLAGEPRRAYCDQCGAPLVCQALAPEEFYPLLLAVGLERRLRLNESALCDVYLRNLDAGPLRDVALRIESRVLKEPWEGLVRQVERGQADEPGAIAELLPVHAGKTILQFRLEFTDARGARRTYEGRLRMAIQPSETSRPAQVTLSFTNSKVMGNDLSDLIRWQEPPEHSLGGEEVCRMPVALTLAGLEPASAPGGPAAPLETPPETRYCLNFLGAEAGRRVLLLARPRLALGMHKHTRNPRVDLTLRLLPCRSAALDPENWNGSRQISSPHATLEVREDKIFIRDEGSLNGTFWFDGNAASGAPPEAAACEWRRVTPGEWTPLPERCAIALGRGVLALRARVCRDSRGALCALALQRLNNAQHLEYVQAVRRVDLGGAEQCAVRLRKGPPLAASLEWTGQGFRLVCRADAPPLRVDGRPLRGGEAAALDRPCLIEAGPYRWLFGPADAGDFLYCPEG